MKFSANQKCYPIVPSLVPFFFPFSLPKANISHIISLQPATSLQVVWLYVQLDSLQSLCLSIIVCLQPQTHGITTGGQCVPCHCNSFGSKSFDCDENGQCRCQPGVTGPKCDRCSRGFFMFQEGGCTRKLR